MNPVLIVGLGNPGEKYLLTRHNIGFMVVDKLVEKHGAAWKKPKHKLFSRPNYVEALLLINGVPVQLIKPLTYMNESGVAVKQALGLKLQALGLKLQALGLKLQALGLKLQALGGKESPTVPRFAEQGQTLLTISDEYNFPVGRVDLKRGGSSGGHNGLQSVIDELGTSDFWRLRCGIGRDFGPGELVNYVLSPFPDDDLEKVEAAINEAVKKLEEFCA